MLLAWNSSVLAVDWWLNTYPETALVGRCKLCCKESIIDDLHSWPKSRPQPSAQRRSYWGLLAQYSPWRLAPPSRLLKAVPLPTKPTIRSHFQKSLKALTMSVDSPRGLPLGLLGYLNLASGAVSTGAGGAVSYRSARGHRQCNSCGRPVLSRSRVGSVAAWTMRIK